MRTLPIFLTLLLLTAGCGSPEAPASPDSPAVPDATTPETAPAPNNVVPDGPLEAESDTVTVVFFGDSLTAGYGLASPGRDAYPVLVGEQLKTAGVPARVVNAGSSGETSAGGLRRVDWVLSRTRPDVFVLALGGNDALRALSPADMRANLGGILKKVRASAQEARLVIAGMQAPPNLGAEYTAQFQSVFADLAREYDAALVPFLLEGVAGDPALNQSDGVHPTPEGQRILAQTVGRVVVPVAREAAAS